MDQVALAESRANRRVHSSGSAWSTLLALETLLADFREEFGGEEIVPKLVTASLARSRERLLKLHANEHFNEPYELPPVDEEWLSKLRAAARQDEELYL